MALLNWYLFGLFGVNVSRFLPPVRQRGRHWLELAGAFRRFLEGAQGVIFFFSVWVNLIALTTSVGRAGRAFALWSTEF